MANPLRVPRGTAASIESRILLSGEIAWATDEENLRVGDGETAGGIIIGGRAGAGETGSGGRLTPVSGAPVVVSDHVGVDIVYFTPYGDDTFATWDGNSWTLSTFSELTLTLAAAQHLANTNYDVFCAVSSSALVIGTGPAWSNSECAYSATNNGVGFNQARGTGAGTTELESFKGAVVNKNAITLRNGASTTYSISARGARYVGSIRTLLAGQTEDVGYGAPARRYIYNALNPVPRIAQCHDTDPTHNYSTPAFRRFNDDDTLAPEILDGLGRMPVSVRANGVVITSAVETRDVYLGIGRNSPQGPISAAKARIGNLTDHHVIAHYSGHLDQIGLNKIYLLQYGGEDSTTGTETWLGWTEGKDNAGIVVEHWG
jgi:hypothetical protein